jgi:hypothetical protein
MRGRVQNMPDKQLDKRKLNMIKVKVIEIEKSNIIEKDPSDAIVEKIRKYIEKVVDGKC